jgi:hypothetical protein
MYCKAIQILQLKIPLMASHKTYLLTTYLTNVFQKFKPEKKYITLNQFCDLLTKIKQCRLVTFSEYLITQENFLNKQLHNYPQLSHALLTCFVMCASPNVFISTHHHAYKPTNLSEYKSVISTTDAKGTLPGS